MQSKNNENSYNTFLCYVIDLFLEYCVQTHDIDFVSYITL